MSTETLPQRSRWRSFFVGSALVLAGVIVGVGTSAMSQGFGPRHGWSDDGDYDRSDRGGDRDRGFDRDRDGPRFWHRFGQDGPRGWFGRDRDGGRFGGDGDGWRGRRFGRFGGEGGRFGGPFMSPGRIERMVDRLGRVVDASTEQKQKIRDILQHTADDVRPLREKVRDTRRQVRDLLTAPTIDRAKL